MVIRGFNKTTLLDFPGKVASTIFTGGCNFKCGFCQNSALVLNPEQEPEISEEEVFSYLRKRQGIIEGVCISGGEPTLQPDLVSFIEKLKETGVAVKLDTNGYRPDILEELMEKRLLDMVAMDIKSDEEGYGRVAGLQGLDFNKIKSSAALLMKGDIDHEFRTTVVREYFDEKIITNISRWLKGAKKYFLQRFEDNGSVIVSGLSSPETEELIKYKDILLETMERVEIRGIDY